jgi:hypothetical protein
MQELLHLIFPAIVEALRRLWQRLTRSPKPVPVPVPARYAAPNFSLVLDDQRAPNSGYRRSFRR